MKPYQKYLLIALHIILLCISSFVVYYNSLDNWFCFDDHLAIVNNKDSNPENDFKDLWRHDIWGKVSSRYLDFHRIWIQSCNFFCALGPSRIR